MRHVFALTALLFAVPAHAVDIEWVTVGDPGNPADTTYWGAVAGTYRIGTYEVTNAQYAEFLNDPPIRARTASSPAPILYPREPSQPGSYLLRTAEGRFEIPWHYDPLTPAFSIDAGDAQAYVDWLNDRAVSSGEPWTYALPTLVELDRVRRWVAGGS